MTQRKHVPQHDKHVVGRTVFVLAVGAFVAFLVGAIVVGSIFGGGGVVGVR